MFYHQTEGWSLLDSFYFSFISLIPTGVNAGLIPEATISKWFTSLFCIKLNIRNNLTMVMILKNCEYNNDKEMIAMCYENEWRLNRQTLWFTILHTIIIFNIVIDFEFLI
ncbi:hypothetical protein [Planomicrobium okeanokoites]|uniref:hypothetical protein n=1 Tax=Planomicrobium okeanokoites TaxID=244 RepID=UPI003CD0E127